MRYKFQRFVLFGVPMSHTYQFNSEGIKREH